MTRLTRADVIDISGQLAQYDKELQKKTGRTLLGIACKAAGVGEAEAGTTLKSITACIVPMDCGQGIIEGFCDAVKHIVQHLGCRAFVASHSDASGVAEAFEKKSDILFLADDYRFVAITGSGGCVVDNSLSTAKGYVAGLSLMLGGLAGRQVLVVGCGQVGRHAAILLVSAGAQVAVCDIKQDRVSALTAEVEKLKGVRMRAEDRLEAITTQYDGLLDATPAAQIIQPKHVGIHTCVSAPGVPHGLCSDTLETVGRRFLHDPLQIGVAAMLVEAVKGL